MRIVIVEDSELISSQIIRALGVDPRIQVIQVVTREGEAIDAILALKPEAVLLDLGLAAGSGLAVLARIRQAGLASRVLVLTNSVEDVVRQRCEALGISGFYDKSSEADACFERLRQFLPPLPANAAPRPPPPVLPRIAVLDDEPDILRAVATMLQDSAYVIDTFTRVKDLMNSPHFGRHQFAILDISLPELDFFDLMGLAGARLGPCTLILLSGQIAAVVDAAAMVARKVGCEVRHIVPKPFTRSQLRAALDLCH